MFLTAKKAAFAGITLALSFILMMVGSIWEASTLFFLAAAAFCIGIVIREFGLKAGTAFLAASVLLAFFLAPNKLYVATYGVMELYILLRESIWELAFAKREKGEAGQESQGKPMRGLRMAYLFAKWALFQVLFLPLLFLAPQLFFAGEMETTLLIFLIIGGQVLWLVADMAYDVFQIRIWGGLRKRIGIF